MPYGSNSELPAAVRHAYSEACQTVFRGAFNGSTGPESSQFAIAHAAAKRCMAKKELHPVTSLVQDAPVSEVKSVQVRDFELKESGQVAVQFSKLNEIDHDADVTYPGAIPTKAVAMSAYGHTSWPHRGSQLPPGRGEVKEDGGFGLFLGQFFMNTTVGRDHYETVKAMGDLQEWSYGFDVKDWEPKPKQFPGARRGLKSLDIHEVSPVLLGSGKTTSTLAIKSLLDEDGELLVGSFTDQADRVLAALKDLHVREEDIIDLRLKEGRAISQARRERLAAQRDVLRALLEGHEALLAETEPKPKDGDAGIVAPDGKAALLHAQAKLREELVRRGYRELIPAN